MENVIKPDQTFSVVNMQHLVMDGVNDIAGCDGNRIILNTVLGRITLEGDELRIEKLTGAGGQIVVNGKISAVYMTPAEEKRGLFKRLLS